MIDRYWRSARTLSLAAAAVSTAALLMSACNSQPNAEECRTSAEYSDDYAAGQAEARAQMDRDYNRGVEAGLALTRANGVDEGRTAGYNRTYRGAFDAAYTTAYNTAYTNGVAEGRTDVAACNAGGEAGLRDGQDDGFADSYPNAHAENQGSADGWATGRAEGELQGYNDGYEVGYPIGEDTGATNCLAGAANPGEFNDRCFNFGYMNSYAATEYNRGYAAGRDDRTGNADYWEGIAAGQAEGEIEGISVGTANGQAAGGTDGRRDGIVEGQRVRFEECYAANYGPAYTSGEDAAYQASYEDTYAPAYTAAYEEYYDGFETVGALEIATGSGYGELVEIDPTWHIMTGSGGMYAGWSDGYRDGYEALCPPFGGAGASASVGALQREILQAGRAYGLNMNGERRVEGRTTNLHGQMLPWAQVRASTGRVEQSVFEIGFNRRVSEATRAQLRATREASHERLRAEARARSVNLPVFGREAVAPVSPRGI